MGIQINSSDVQTGVAQPMTLRPGEVVVAFARDEAAGPLSVSISKGESHKVLTLGTSLNDVLEKNNQRAEKTPGM